MTLTQNPPIRIEPLRQPHQAKRPPPPPHRLGKVCTIEKKWKNHEAHECYFWPKYNGIMQIYTGPMQAPQKVHFKPMKNLKMTRQMERSQPILGKKPSSWHKSS